MNELQKISWDDTKKNRKSICIQIIHQMNWKRDLFFKRGRSSVSAKFQPKKTQFYFFISHSLLNLLASCNLVKLEIASWPWTGNKHNEKRIIIKDFPTSLAYPPKINLVLSPSIRWSNCSVIAKWIATLRAITKGKVCETSVWTLSLFI